MTIIINVGQEFGTKDGVITKNAELRIAVNAALKKGNAKKIIDTDETLMYKIN